MALFNRQKNSDVPAELQPYYDAPKSGSRNWLRWVIRIAALLIVLALLFVAGRWAWQKIDKNDKQVGTEQATEQRSGDRQSNTDNKDETQAGNGNSSSNNDTDPQTTPNTSNADNSDDDQPASGQTLASTGPAENVAVFTIATAAGIVGYQIYVRVKKKTA